MTRPNIDGRCIMARSITCYNGFNVNPPILLCVIFIYYQPISSMFIKFLKNKSKTIIINNQSKHFLIGCLKIQLAALGLLVNLQLDSTLNCAFFSVHLIEFNAFRDNVNSY